MLTQVLAIQNHTQWWNTVVMVLRNCGTAHVVKMGLTRCVDRPGYPRSVLT